MIIYDVRNKGFTEQLVQNYVNQVQNLLQVTPEIIAYDPSKKETITAVQSAISSRKPEALFMVASAEECAKIANYVSKDQLSIQLYGPLWANTQELIRKGGSAVNGMQLVGGIDQAKQSPEYSAFKEKYEDHYGEPPTFASMYTYETLMALAESIKACRSTEPEAVKTEMLKIGKFKGVQDSFEIDAFGDNTRAYLLMQIEDGILRKVE